MKETKESFSINIPHTSDKTIFLRFQLNAQNENDFVINFPSFSYENYLTCRWTFFILNFFPLLSLFVECSKKKKMSLYKNEKLACLCTKIEKFKPWRKIKKIM